MHYAWRNRTVRNISITRALRIRVATESFREILPIFRTFCSSNRESRLRKGVYGFLSWFRYFLWTPLFVVWCPLSAGALVACALSGHVHNSEARVLFDCALYNFFYPPQVLVHISRSATELNAKPSLSSNSEKKHELAVTHTSISGWFFGAVF